MAGPNVKLSGWKAVLVLLVLAGAAGFREVTARAAIDTQGRAALQRWVQAQVIRPIVADTTLTLAQQDSALTQATAVTIKSIAVHGTSQKAVVRVELNPSPALPPGTKMVRYYRAQYSVLSGWMHHGSSNVLEWWLAAF